MTKFSNATPLIALDAFVIDTETTGLDPAKARVVEIGAVPLRKGRLDESASLRQLINPGEPIPAEATRIHAIDDSMVASAPNFAAVWPDFSAATSGEILIGHTFGFDLAVLKRECERAGLPWVQPRTLDTRLLALVAEPHLGGYTLEHLASWLGVTIEDRHSARADAIVTGKIFLALLSKLREGNIRTLAEAEQACLTLTGALEDQHRAGWEEAIKGPRAREEGTFARIDPYPYRHRIADVMSAPPKTVAANVSLAETLQQMAREKISSLLVAPPGFSTKLRANDTAIITERDVLRALAEYGPGAITRPVAQFASKPLIAVPAAAFVYLALARMSRLRLRHLGVEDESGEIIGIVTSRDLLRLRAQEASMLGDALNLAADVPSLAAAWARLPRAAAALIAEGVTGREIAAVISRELGALTRYACRLAEQQMKAGGFGDPPCAYALCVLGSAGRGESLLAMDQDNAIVFADGAPEAADQWFARLGVILADILHEVGVPYCKGGVMVKNPQWRGSMAIWRARIADWVTRSNPADLLSVDIFFDLVGVHGDLAMANELWRSAFDAAQGNVPFAKLLAEAAGEVETGITILGNFRTENGRIDLKKTGLFGIVTSARVLAIRHHLFERSTPARLAAVAGLGLGGVVDLDALALAHGEFLELILAQQVADIHDGRPPSNKVLVKRLSREQRARLHKSLRTVRHLDALTHDLLF